LTRELPNGHSIAYYVTECEAYGERTSIPQPEKCNNLPACPYALQEMKKNRIAYAFGAFAAGISEEHLQTIRAFDTDPNKRTLFYIILDQEDIAFEEGVELSKKFSATLTGRHPEFLDEEKEMTIIFSSPKKDPGDYVQRPPFCFFLIQYSVDLLVAEEKLIALGYYDNIKPDELVMCNFGHHQQPPVDPGLPDVRP
jgi:hypothetical protein